MLIGDKGIAVPTKEMILMKRAGRQLLMLVLALLICCGLATAALAATDGKETDPAEQATAKGYTLSEDIEIADDAVPLAAGAMQTRCVLHLVLCVPILAAGTFYLYSRHWHRARQRELLARLQR